MPAREEKKRKEEIGKKGGAAPKGAPRGEVSEEREVTVRLSGKDLDIMFSSPEEAGEWKNRFTSMMEQEGYHIGKEKPESMQAEAGAEATSQ